MVVVLVGDCGGNDAGAWLVGVERKKEGVREVEAWWFFNGWAVGNRKDDGPTDFVGVARCEGKKWIEFEIWENVMYIHWFRERKFKKKKEFM